MESTTVSDWELVGVLKRLRDTRRWAVRADVNPWAYRQAIIFILELDTAAALERGVSKEHLESFDSRAQEDARSFLREAGA